MHLRVQIHLERRRLVLWRVQLGNLIARQEAVRRILARAWGGGLRDWRQRSTCHSGWMPRVCVRWKGTPLNPASSVFINRDLNVVAAPLSTSSCVGTAASYLAYFFFCFFFLGGGRGMLTWVRSHLMSLSFRYAILLNCWRHERGERPEFEKLAAQLHAIDLGACAPDYETPSAPPPARPPRSGKWWYTRFSRLCHFSMTFFFLFCRLIDKNEELFFFWESQICNFLTLLRLYRSLARSKFVRILGPQSPAH